MKQQLNEIKRMQQLAGLSEADLPGDIAREEAINKYLAVAIEAIENLQDIYEGDIDSIFNLIRNEMEAPSSSVSDEDLPY